jgi:hypothetical protein
MLGQLYLDFKNMNKVNNISKIRYQKITNSLYLIVGWEIVTRN